MMAVTRDMTELQIFKTVLLYCSFIIFLPILSFFSSKFFIFDGILGLTSTPSNIYAAIISIVVLHVALGAFIYKAYYDGQTKVAGKKE